MSAKANAEKRSMSDQLTAVKMDLVRGKLLQRNKEIDISYTCTCKD